MTNREILQDLLLDIFLLDPSEFSFDLKREEIQTWDSMAVVAIAIMRGCLAFKTKRLEPPGQNGSTVMREQGVLSTGPYHPA